MPTLEREGRNPLQSMVQIPTAIDYPDIRKSSTKSQLADKTRTGPTVVPHSSGSEALSDRVGSLNLLHCLTKYTSSINHVRQQCVYPTLIIHAVKADYYN